MNGSVPPGGGTWMSLPWNILSHEPPLGAWARYLHPAYNLGCYDYGDPWVHLYYTNTGWKIGVSTFLPWQVVRNWNIQMLVIPWMGGYEIWQEKITCEMD